MKPWYRSALDTRDAMAMKLTVIPRRDFAIGIIDLGLTQDQRDRLQQFGATVVAPGWDYDLSHHRETTADHFKAMTARPNLPQHFPGFDLYMWLDADCWIQDWRAIDVLIKSAMFGKFAVAQERHRSYFPYLAAGGSYIDLLRLTYTECGIGEAEATRLSHAPPINSGVFCATADAPHWTAWRSALGGFLRHLDRFVFLVEQTALYYAIWQNDLRTFYVPPLCNWMCHMALPLFDSDT